jgi:hypothetical protein
MRRQEPAAFNLALDRALSSPEQWLKIQQGKDLEGIRGNREDLGCLSDQVAQSGQQGCRKIVGQTLIRKVCLSSQLKLLSLAVAG